MLVWQYNCISHAFIFFFLWELLLYSNCWFWHPAVARLHLMVKWDRQVFFLLYFKTLFLLRFFSWVDFSSPTSQLVILELKKEQCNSSDSLEIQDSYRLNFYALKSYGIAEVCINLLQRKTITLLWTAADLVKCTHDMKPQTFMRPSGGVHPIKQFHLLLFILRAHNIIN